MINHSTYTAFEIWSKGTAFSAENLRKVEFFVILQCETIKTDAYVVIRKEDIKEKSVSLYLGFPKSPKRRKFPINTKLMPAFIVGFTCIGNLTFGDATENVRVQSTVLFLSRPQKWTG